VLFERCAHHGEAREQLVSGRFCLMRILLFNVKYSANLGDGLLTECLERELAIHDGVASVRSVDLATRTQYGLVNPHRRHILALLEHLPSLVRRAATQFILRRLARTRLSQLCREGLREADVAVVGGGNLLADADLNFPIKVHCALRETAARAKPVAIFGVGVSANWSETGRKLFTEGLSASRLAHIAVRDTRSKTIWDEYLTPVGLPPAELCRDPGLLSAIHFPAAPRRQRIGLCLTDPLALRYHGGTSDDATLSAWLVAIGAGLVEAGHRLTLFTNGSPEDRAYLDKLAPRIKSACGDAVEIEPPFERPVDLARLISSCTAIIAHRMHACIAAYAYGIPAIGLSWDPKLDSFFASVRRSEYLLDPATVDTGSLVPLVERAIAAGIDAGFHDQVVEEARADVRRLYDRLKLALAS
jgi:polysaccharide pyruvyl transferase WcaK-like protein